MHSFVLKGISHHLHILHHISLDIKHWVLEYIYQENPFTSLINSLSIRNLSGETTWKNHKVQLSIKKYSIVISNCVERYELTCFLLCAQAYFHTNMPIICHKCPRKSTRVGWRVISLPWMDRDL